jgi:hypothetical protein
MRALTEFVAPHALDCKQGACLFAQETMLGIQLVQQWFIPTDLPMDAPSPASPPAGKAQTGQTDSGDWSMTALPAVPCA